MIVKNEALYENPPMGKWNIRCEKEGIVEKYNELFLLASMSSELTASFALFDNRLIEINKLTSLAARISKYGWTTLFCLDGSVLIVFMEGKELLTMPIFGEDMEEKTDPLYWKDLYLNKREIYDEMFPPFLIEV